ncbi:MAG: TldD/PmbA family protein [Candidatus Thorarchaeota archaeon]|nr:TldD/PmbA family protein [Candidatus Thorarchaeota archaeon]
MMLNVLERAVESGRDMGATYVEVRGEKSFLEFIQMDDYKVTALTQRIEQGVAIRVLADGAWGFVSTGNLDQLNKAVSDATALAKAAAKTRREPIELAEIKTCEDKVTLKVEKDPKHVPIEEKINYLTNMSKSIFEYDERISATTLKLETASGEKFLVTSEGTKIQSPIMLVWSMPWASGKDGSKLSAARHQEASTNKGWEYMESFATPEFMGETTAKRVKLQLEGVSPKVGSFPCVLGPRVVGTFAHEVLGHLAEADLNVHTPFNGKIGAVVASAGLSMVDDGTNFGQVGVGKYDDEGVPTSRVEIIKDSVLAELLTNREYAAKLGQRVTGNARAQSYLVPPAIRMRSTFIESGDFQEEEMFEGIDFGYFCVDFRGGSAQMNASFQVGIQEAYEIVKGEIGQPVADLSISGIGTDSLLKIDAISKKELHYGAGRCGKFGQWAYVSDGGTDIRFSKGGITFGGKS